MIFSNLLKRIGLLAVVFLMGCQFSPSGLFNVKVGDSIEPDSAQRGPEQALPTAPAPIENPYLSTRSSVSASVSSRWEQVIEAMTAQNWQQAEMDLKWLVENSPELSGPKLNLGIVYLNLDKPDLAEQQFKAALQVNPSNGDIYNRYGLLLREQGRFNEAKALYIDALDIWPDNKDSHMNLAILYDLYLGQWDLALQHYQEVLRLSDEQSKKAVKGWLIDLERRMKQRENRG